MNSNTDHTIKNQDDSAWKSIDPDSLAPGARYNLCISAIVPRPVGVLTTISSPFFDNDFDDKDSHSNKTIVNCAPFSYTSLSTHDPPIVTHGICLSRGKKKDSLRNIEATGEWVLNVLDVGYLEKANDASSPMV